MSQQVDISGLSKAAVLASLFNATAPNGMGFLQAMYGPTVMTEQDAAQHVDTDSGALDFDYLFGRPLKVDISGDSFNPWGLDRDAGEGTAEKAIKRLRDTGAVSDEDTDQRVNDLTMTHAHEAMEFANTPSSVNGNTFVLGGDDVGAVLEHAVDQEVNRRRTSQ